MKFSDDNLYLKGFRNKILGLCALCCADQDFQLPLQREGEGGIALPFGNLGRGRMI